MALIKQFPKDKMKATRTYSVFQVTDILRETLAKLDELIIQVNKNTVALEEKKKKKS